MTTRLLACVFYVIAAATAEASCQFDLQHSSYSFGDGNSTGAVALVDFTRDSRLDIAIANSRLENPNDSFVYLMPGFGDGTFGEPSRLGVGPNPFGVLSGNLNGDEWPDLVVPFGAFGYASGVTVLIGDGTENATRTDYHFGNVVVAAFIGDLNGDGKADIAAASFVTDSIFILLANGNGTFRSPAEYPAAGSGPQGLAAGDFDENGALDLVTVDAYTATASIFYGRGDGTFETATSVPTGNNPFAVVSDDFNRDRHADLAIVNDFDFSVTVMRGDGRRGFINKTYNANPFPEGMVSGDFDSDGYVDLAIGNSVSGYVSLFRGRGNGDFAEPVTFAGGSNAYMLAGGDVDGDNDVDLAIANAGGVSVLQNRTDCAPVRRRSVR